jgi:hypothetical protein
MKLLRRAIFIWLLPNALAQLLYCRILAAPGTARPNGLELSNSLHAAVTDEHRGTILAHIKRFSMACSAHYARGERERKYATTIRCPEGITGRL